jgi:hypothetical protein
MLVFVVISLLIGMVLGQRFKVLVLVPAIGLALIVTTVAGIARADSVWLIVVMTVAVTSSLQIGYLAGTGIRHLMAAARASRLRAGALGGSMPARHPVH